MVIILGGLACWRPRYGLLALMVAWPSYLVRTEVLGVPTTALELSLYAVAAATALHLFTKRLAWHWVRMTRWSWWFLAIWIVAWNLSLMAATDMHAALGAIKAWLIDPLLFTALLAILIQTESHRRQAIHAAVISGGVVAIAGLIQLVGFPETLQEGRLSSFFAPVANYAAMFLGPLVVLAAGLLLLRYLRGWWWLALGVMLLATVLTISFGAYLAVAIGGTFIWWYLPAGRMKRQLLFTGLVAVALGLAIISQTKNFSQHFDFSGRSSGLVRQQIWVTSWALVQQHPWLGIGPNNFERAYREELPKHYFPPLEWLVAQPHNLYLALWLETGLLGLITFVALVAFHGIKVWRNFFPIPEQRAIAVASLAAIITVLVHGWVDTPYFKNDLALEFMFIAVLPWLGQKKEKVAKPEFTSG